MWQVDLSNMNTHLSHESDSAKYFVSTRFVKTKVSSFCSVGMVTKCVEIRKTIRYYQFGMYSSCQES